MTIPFDAGITKTPQIPDTEDYLLGPIKEVIEIREGLRGNPLDRFVRVRDLRELILSDATIVDFLSAGHRHDGQTLEHDGVSSDGGAFLFSTTGPITFSYGDIRVGLPDNTQGGITLYGDKTGSGDGGYGRFELAADFDDTIEYYEIKANEDDLLIGTDLDPNIIKLDFDKDVYLSGGSLILPAGEYLNFGGVLGSGGYGIRDNAGAMETKDSGGAWQPIPSAGVAGVGEGLAYFFGRGH